MYDILPVIGCGFRLHHAMGGNRTRNFSGDIRIHTRICKSTLPWYHDKENFKDTKEVITMYIIKKLLSRKSKDR